MPSWGRQRGARLGQLRAQMAADEDDLVQFDKDDPDFVRQDPQDGMHGEWIGGSVCFGPMSELAPCHGLLGGAGCGDPPPSGARRRPTEYVQLQHGRTPAGYGSDPLHEAPAI